MKKLLGLIFSFALCFTALSAKENFISFTAGLTSGFPIYGTNSVVSTGSEIEKGNRVILGTLTTVNLNVAEQVSFFVGNDLLWDLTWNASENSNKLHVSFPLGIKVYPNLGGLNFGLAYTLGFRNDRIKTTKNGSYNGSTVWGNGFKFHIEYNFAHDGAYRYLPSIGGYWNLMPRGKYSYDNLIVMYVAINY